MYCILQRSSYNLLLISFQLMTFIANLRVTFCYNIGYLTFIRNKTRNRSHKIENITKNHATQENNRELREKRFLNKIPHFSCLSAHVGEMLS